MSPRRRFRPGFDNLERLNLLSPFSFVSAAGAMRPGGLGQHGEVDPVHADHNKKVHRPAHHKGHHTNPQGGRPVSPVGIPPVVIGIHPGVGIPASTGPVSTGPVSTGPVSTGPVSTGPVLPERRG
jgi:hypothetical protein